MLSLKNSLFIKFVFFIVSLQMLNMSIGAPVAHIEKAAAAEDSNFIDTYVEFITEVIFKYENAIPEPRHRQHRELQSHQQVLVICQQILIPCASPASSFLTFKNYLGYTNNYAFRFIKQLNRPPSIV